jgi:hypothetical protein
MTLVPTTGRSTALPLNGWRGEHHPEVWEPTPAERARHCPFCGQAPGITATSWCPSFDELIRDAALALSA